MAAVPSTNPSLTDLRARLQAETTDGQKLLASPGDNPVCSIALDESLRGLVVTWRDYATSTQFRFIHEYMLELIATHRVTKILGDDTHLQTIHAEDQAWVTQNWMPRAVESGLRAAASKGPSAYFAQVAVGRVVSAAPAPLSIQIFTTTADARKWLQSFQC